MSVAEASFAVGMIGLAQFLPLFALTLVAGDAADRHDRRRILALCYLAQLLTSVGTGGPVFARGRAVADLRPGCAVRLRPGVLPAGGERPRPDAGAAPPAPAGDRDQLAGRPTGQHPRSGLGRLLCVVSPILGYAVSAGLYATAAACALLIRADTRPTIEAPRSRIAQIREGLRYIWGNKLVLGAISLDLFAVLLGGATGLLPVFARDVLEVGPQGFGVLRASPRSGPSWWPATWPARPIRSRAA